MLMKFSKKIIYHYVILVFLLVFVERQVVMVKIPREFSECINLIKWKWYLLRVLKILIKNKNFYFHSQKN